MFYPLSAFIGLRYTRAKRRNQFISFISLTSMIGLALGVMAMIVVLSVMNGFYNEMSGRILGMVPQATISLSARPLSDWKSVAHQAMKNKQVIAAVPFTHLEGMMSASGVMQAMEFYGVDPSLESKVDITDQHMVQGTLKNLQANQYGIVIGEQTARRFRLSLGDKITLIIPEKSSVPGGVTPRIHRFNVAGIFKIGADLDSSLALIHIADAAKIQHYSKQQVQSVRLKFKDLYTAPETAKQIAKNLGENYTSGNWTDTQGSLFSAMKMEKTMIGLLLLLIIAVAVFNIIATLIMVVSDKRTDIAILRTLGATPKQIMGVFMVQGIVIGSFGTLLGCISGILVALNVSQIVGWFETITGQHVFSSSVYFISTLPSDLQWKDVMFVCVAALVLSFLATLYPSLRASRTLPAEALRYE